MHSAYGWLQAHEGAIDVVGSNHSSACMRCNMRRVLCAGAAVAQCDAMAAVLYSGGRPCSPTRRWASGDLHIAYIAVDQLGWRARSAAIEGCVIKFARRNYPRCCAPSARCHTTSTMT
jgi:hypothetical protein